MYLEVNRTVPREAGTITPTIVGEMLDDMLEELGENILEALQGTGAIKIDVDVTDRSIRVSVELRPE